IEHRAGTAKPLDQPEWRLPETAVEIQDDARMRAGVCARPREYLLHVPDVVDQIRQQDPVEGLPEFQFVRITHDEAQPRMALPGDANHLGRKVDTGSRARLHGSQQVARPAADFEDALARGNQPAINLVETAVIAAIPAIDSIERSRH